MVGSQEGHADGANGVAVTQEVTYIVFAPENPGAPVFTRRMVDGLALKQLVESLAGQINRRVYGAESHREEAEEIGRILFE